MRKKSDRDFILRKLSLYQLFRIVLMATINFVVSIICAFFNKGVILKWPLLIFFGIAGFLFGWWGFALDPEYGFSNTESIYRSIMLFFFEGGSDLAGEKLQIARFLAAGVTIYTILLTLLHLFHERIRILQPRLWNGHMIVAGLGDIGLKIIDEKISDYKNIVVIEKNPNNENIKEVEKLGAIVLIGDATDPHMLEMSGIAFAKHLVSSCRSDGKNFEIVYQASKLMEAKKHLNINERLNAYIHFSDPELVSLLHNHPLINNLRDRIEITIFNLFEYTARKVFKDHPLDYVRITEDSTKFVHLIIIGFARIGEALFKQAAMIGHFANESKKNRLKITVIDKKSDLLAKKKDHYAALQIDKICNTEFIDKNIEVNNLLPFFDELTKDPLSIATVAICINDEISAALYANELFKKISKGQLLVYISKEKGIANLLTEQKFNKIDNNKGDKFKKIIPFGKPEDIQAKEAVMFEKHDLMARKIFYDFQRLLPKKDQKSWKEIPEWEKISNRSQADHIEIKLRAINCYTAEKPKNIIDKKISELNENDHKNNIKLMAKMEHNRWIAERYLNGWQQYKGNTPWSQLTKEDQTKLKNESRQSGCLIPWEDLPNEEQVKDYDAVKNIPNILNDKSQTTKIHIYRNIAQELL